MRIALVIWNFINVDAVLREQTFKFCFLEEHYTSPYQSLNQTLPLPLCSQPTIKLIYGIQMNQKK